MRRLDKTTLNLKMYDIAILGGGASGLMCGANLPKNLKILIIEAGMKLAQKVRVSGGGNCNITNEFISSDDFLGDREFLKPLLNNYSHRDILNYFNSIKFEKRKKNQFFAKNGSQEVVEYLKQKTSHCKILLDTKCEEVEKNGDTFKLFTTKGVFRAKSLVVASGGLSFPNLNASDIGYNIATNFLHEVRTPNPALVGFTVQKDEFWVKELSGISLSVKIKVGAYEFEDDLLFSHKGLSGPAILNASLFWEKGKISIDFMPTISLHEVVKKDKNRLISSLLPLPKRFCKVFLKAVEVEDKHIKYLTKKDFEKLDKIHDYTFSPAGNFGYKKAEVTKGGVKTDGINPQTYESKRVENLYFLGEVLDITGRLGGFNLFFAFASAMQFAKKFKT